MGPKRKFGLCSVINPHSPTNVSLAPFTQPDKSRNVVPSFRLTISKGLSCLPAASEPEKLAVEDQPEFKRLHPQCRPFCLKSLPTSLSFPL